MIRARRAPWLVLAAAILLACHVGPAASGDWGGIVPGETRMGAVRVKYGAPTRTRKELIESYDTTQWIFEGTQAPPGIRRMIVDFGLRTLTGYSADVVRSLRLEPTPGAFNRAIVLEGWGTPSRQWREKDADMYFYREGLFVAFKPNGFEVDFMLFTPPQPAPADAGERKP
jgi:hypothetical protein